MVYHVNRAVRPTLKPVLIYKFLPCALDRESRTKVNWTHDYLLFFICPESTGNRKGYNYCKLDPIIFTDKI